MAEKKPNPNMEVFCTPAGSTRVEYVTPWAVRVTHIPSPDGDFTADRPWLKHVLLPQPVPENHSLKVTMAQDHISILGVNDWRFSEIHPPRFFRNEKVQIQLGIQPNEIFYGWGEWFNAFYRTRGRVVLRNRESPAPLQHHQTYSTFPLFFSSRNYALFLLNSTKSVWNIRPEIRSMIIKTDGPPADYILVTGKDLREVIQRFATLTGRPPLLPRWAFGLWLTGYPQEHQDRVLKLAQEHRQRKIPLDAIILDYHWEERFHNFQWRKGLFPEPDSMIKSLKSMGIRLGLIFTPFINHKNQPVKKYLINLLVKNIAQGTEKDDERALNEYASGKEGGFFAQPDAEWWFGRGGMVDFTHPIAARWWNDKLKPLYEQGVEFFKNDDGEYLPDDAVSAIGISGMEYHNLYGFFYGKSIYEGMEELDNRRGLIYARSVWVGSQRYPALFLGDQKPTPRHIRQTLRAGLNLAMAGFSYWTADVFGLDGRVDEEMHMRYSQYALMLPVARYFIRPMGVDGTRFPWSFGGKVEESFRRHLELRYRLLPYFHCLAWEAHHNGLPVVRPMLLEFPSDERFLKVDDQFMLGGDLLMAPVMERGARSRLVNLPSGVWYNWWTGTRYLGGGIIKLDAPVDYLPLLIRGGAILPLGPVLQFIPDGHTFDNLEFHCWPPFAGERHFIEDDGATRAYLRGNYSKLIIRVSQSNGDIETVVIDERGNPAKMDQRKWRFIFHDEIKPEKS